MSSWRWLFLLLLFGAWHGWQEREQSQPPGVLAPSDPVQTEAEDPAPFRKGDYTLTPLAHFAIEARVLGKEIYRFDGGAELAPVDLALGWGLMSDSSVLSRLSISQGQRFYFWRSSDLPAATSEIAKHSANMHLIPATSSLKSRLKAVRTGQLIRFSGQLVAATRPDGWNWRSSLTRTDTGPGACELVWVEEVEVK
jgi:hypothetical protein